MNPLWPSQEQGIGDVLAAIARGERRICLTSPTGGGKTRIVTELIERWLEEQRRVVLYTNRKALVEQLARELDKVGLPYGVRAAGHSDNRDQPLQISSIQTEGSRVLRSNTWELHPAHYVVIDEAHLQKGADAQTIMQKHVEAGAVILGVTATPLDIGDLYDCLITAGTNSELRQYGALVMADHYGCDEPDMAAWKKSGALKGWQEGENLSERQAAKVMMTTGLIGRVLEWFEELNPTRRPSILFAPGVRESLWFAEQFANAGITAAHIDGDDVWINGEFQKASPESRRQVLEMSSAGEVTVLCNRFVLREGIDAPWLAHGIFATVFGGLSTYLQSGGRLLRAHPSLKTVTIQDHGGNWHVHGSLNADRIWDLEYTSAMVYGMRAERLRVKECVECGEPLEARRPLCLFCGALNEVEPTRCPACGKIIACSSCSCGWKARGEKVGRPVVQSDGTLKMLTGDVFKPRQVCKRNDGPALWKRMYHRSRTAKGDRTFMAAMALYAKENYWKWPGTSWPLMPYAIRDLFRRVVDVPYERLIPEGKKDGEGKV